MLRTVKYGETSLIANIFTATFGVQSYLIQGIRQPSARGRGTRAGLLQPASLLDMVVYHRPGKNLQRIREFVPAQLFHSIQEEVVKNSVAIFSAELLLRLLPEGAPVPELFDFAAAYLRQLDARPVRDAGNFPLWFVVQCASQLGFPLQGAYSNSTPWLSLQAGGFTAEAPATSHAVTTQDAALLSMLLEATTVDDMVGIRLDAAARHRLLEWWLDYLHRHTDHMTPVKSLKILQEVLH